MQSVGPFRALYTSPFGRSQLSVSRKYSVMLQLVHEYYSLTFPPLSTASYSSIQLSQLRQCGENEIAQASKRHQKDSNPGSLDLSPGVQPLTYHHYAVSKLPCIVLSSARSCCSSICPGRLSTPWLVSLFVFSCHMVSKW